MCFLDLELPHFGTQAVSAGSTLQLEAPQAPSWPGPRLLSLHPCRFDQSFVPFSVWSRSEEQLSRVWGTLEVGSGSRLPGVAITMHHRQGRGSPQSGTVSLWGLGVGSIPGMPPVSDAAGVPAHGHVTPASVLMCPLLQGHLPLVESPPAPGHFILGP